MTEYEIKCPQTWAWYTGFVHDYRESDKHVRVTYPDDWKSEQWVELSSVRHRFSKTDYDPLTWRPSEGEEVECKARAEENEPFGWWPCRANKYIDPKSTLASDKYSDFYTVQFIGWGDQHNEVLNLECIRPKSNSKPLSARNIQKQFYDVPTECRDWVLTQCNNNTLVHRLMPYENISSQILHCAYHEQQSKLLLIGNKRVLQMMTDIIFCFFEKQKSLLKVQERTQELERKSQMKREEELKAEKYTFNIHPLLSGYLRGKRGANIENVKKQSKGKVIRIEPRDGSCYIAAKDRQSLLFAVDQLHIVCKKVLIPKEEMGQIIGARHTQILDIKRKSQVIKVVSWADWPYEFETLQRIQKSRYLPYYDTEQNLGAAAEEEGADNNGHHSENMDDTNVPENIRSATYENIFEPEDVIDLSVGYSPEFDEAFTANNENTNMNPMNPDTDFGNDALVIIGRESRVSLCIFMIEMTLSHFRSITKTRNNVRLLRKKIDEIKGKPQFSSRGRGGRRGRGGMGGDRGRGGRGGRGRGARDRGDYENEQKDMSLNDSDVYQTRGGGRGGGGGRGRRGGRGRGRGQYQMKADPAFNNGYNNNNGQRAQYKQRSINNERNNVNVNGMIDGDAKMMESQKRNEPNPKPQRSKKRNKKQNRTKRNDKTPKNPLK